MLRLPGWVRWFFPLLVLSLLQPACKDSGSSSKGTAQGGTNSGANSGTAGTGGSNTGASGSTGGNAGTGSSGTGSSGTGSGTGGAPPSGLWLSGDLHVHSSVSPDANAQGGDPPGVCVNLAEIAGLDYMALTDHRTIAGTQSIGFQSTQITLLVGEEWGSKGHANAVGISTAVPELDFSQPGSTLNTQVKAAIDDCIAQGGVWSINHPCRDGDPWPYTTEGASLVEVWNTHWSLYQRGIVDQAAVRGRMHAWSGGALTPNDAILAATLTNTEHHNEQALVFWEYLLNTGERLGAVGGGDRHMLVLPGQPTTRVFAADRSAASIVAGLRAGRTYITFKPNGPAVELTGDTDGDGIYETIVGGEIASGTARLRIDVSQTIGGKVELIKNGTTFQDFLVGTQDTVDVTDVNARPGDWYRVDYFEPADTPNSAVAAWKNFILNNPIQNPNTSSVGFYLQILQAVPAFFGLNLDLGLGTLLPIVRFDDDYLRIANLYRPDPDWCRAAITSPIYVGP